MDLIIVDIPRGKVHEWLWYETGMDQMHAVPELVGYMASQGCSYGIDWGVRKEPHPRTSPNGYPVHHQLWFTEQEQFMAFRLRWS